MAPNGQEMKSSRSKPPQTCPIDSTAEKKKQEVERQKREADLANSSIELVKAAEKTKQDSANALVKAEQKKRAEAEQKKQ